MEEYITLTDLAQELGIDKSNFLKYVKQHDFKMVKVRTQKSRGQLAWAFSPETADAVREHRKNLGYSYTKQVGVVVENNEGLFYVLQLFPDIAPARVKVGFTSNLVSRMAAHRTVAPSAELIKTWPCKHHWEYTVIDSITRAGCVSLSNEVYDCESIECLVEQCDAFFSLLPNDN